LPATWRASSASPARARDGGADVLLTPELASERLPAGRPADAAGFLPRLRGANRAPGRAPPRCRWWSAIPKSLPGQRYNAASLLANGRIAATYRKHRLPNYEVFDEERYFRRGARALRRRTQRRALRAGDLRRCLGAGRRRSRGAGRGGTDADAECLALPHEQAGAALRGAARTRGGDGKPVIYANLVGGQDELVFDGASFAMDGKGA
jgi:NAD+ synthase (glutamine-hydrolysing)